MWFNNARIFHYELNETLDIAERLSTERLKPCPPHARFIYGWLPAIGDELIQEVAGSVLICMGKEERLLPRGVINTLLTERINHWETTHQRRMKRAEKAQLAEELEFELLPKSFCVQKRLLAMLDSKKQHLIVNTSSANQAAQLTSLLRKSIPELHIEPLAHDDNLALRFAEWINNPNTLPSAFQLASDCLLFCLDDEKKRFTCKGYELPAEEVLTLLSQGLAAAELSLVWKERIQFTLTQDFALKRIRCLDYLMDELHDIGRLDEAYQQQDATLTLLSGEYRQLIEDLQQALASSTNALLTTKDEALLA